MPGGRPGKGGGKKSQLRTKQAAGRMRHHQGHKSKGKKTTLTQAKWNKIYLELMKKAPKTMTPTEAGNLIDAMMRKKYRLRVVNGKK